MSISRHTNNPSPPDEPWFTSRIPALYNQVYMSAMAIAMDVDTAQDITQETFLRGFLKLATLRQRDQLGPWLHRIARNTALQWQRDGRNRSRLLPLIPLEEAPVDPADETRKSPREAAEHAENSSQLTEAIMELPADLRQAVLLHYCEGLSASEIARLNGEYPSTITRRLDKGRELLRAYMERGLAANLASMRPASRQAQRTVALVTAAAALPAAVKAQAVALAADTPVAAGAGGITSLVGSGSAATIISKGFITKMAISATTTKIIAATAIAAGGMLAGYSLMSDPAPKDAPAPPIQRADSTPATRINTLAPGGAGGSASAGKKSAAGAADDMATRPATKRPSAEQRVASLKDDLVSTQPELIIADGETSGRLHFNIMVVNEAGLPVPNATVEMTGRRTKLRTPTWYGWGAPAISATTNKEGLARVSGDQYVEENLELGGVTFNVSHPDYASAHEDMYLDEMKKVVLKSGDVLEVIVSDSESSTPLKAGLDLSFFSRFKPDWSQRGDGTITVRKINDKELSFYATHKEDGKTTAFSPLEKISFPRASRGPVYLTVYRGSTVHGRLSDEVQRPVKNGTVQAFAESGERSCGQYSPQTVSIREDGTFTLEGMAKGNVLIWALADGWCSQPGMDPRYKNAAKQPTHGYPQTFTLTESEQQYTLPMVATATALFKLVDAEGRPAANAVLVTNPNMCYENCCGMWIRRGEFMTTSTVDGTAVIADIPPLANTRFHVSGDYELPPEEDDVNGFERHEKFDLSPGQVLEHTLTVYPKGTTVITQDGDKMTTAAGTQ